jgi:S-(hydroxymethyl)mycothiol dehydrogenase
MQMPQQVECVIAHSKGVPVELVDIVIPDPGLGEVVVAVAACGCATPT